MKFFVKVFFSKCDQIRRKLRIWSHLLKKSLMENFIFCAVIAYLGYTVQKINSELIVGQCIRYKLKRLHKTMSPYCFDEL